MNGYLLMGGVFGAIAVTTIGGVAEDTAGPNLNSSTTRVMPGPKIKQPGESHA